MHLRALRPDASAAEINEAVGCSTSEFQTVFKEYALQRGPVGTCEAVGISVLHIGLAFHCKWPRLICPFVEGHEIEQESGSKIDFQVGFTMFQPLLASGAREWP